MRPCISIRGSVHPSVGPSVCLLHLFLNHIYPSQITHQPLPTIFRCVLTSLWEGLSVRLSIRPLRLFDNHIFCCFLTWWDRAMNQPIDTPTLSLPRALCKKFKRSVCSCIWLCITRNQREIHATQWHIQDAPLPDRACLKSTSLGSTAPVHYVTQSAPKVNPQPHPFNQCGDLLKI